MGGNLAGVQMHMTTVMQTSANVELRSDLMREVVRSNVATRESAGRRLRRSYEPGHRPKFLVLVEDTDDCRKAVHYASRRAARVGANVVLLRVIEEPPGEVAWLGVAEVMQYEAMEQAQQLLNSYASIVKNVGPEEPKTLIRQGEVAVEMFKLIDGLSLLKSAFAPSLTSDFKG